MAGRGPQTFKKRQKEQARKEKQQEKLAKRLIRKQQGDNPGEPEEEDDGLDMALYRDLGDDAGLERAPLAREPEKH
jgi:hypothetical protein